MSNPEITQMTRELAAAESPAHAWGSKMSQQLEFVRNVHATLIDTHPDVPIAPYLQDVLNVASEQIVLLGDQLRDSLLQRFGSDAYDVYAAVYVEDQTPENMLKADAKFDQLYNKFNAEDPSKGTALVEESLVPYYWGILKPYRADKPQS